MEAIRYFMTLCMIGAFAGFSVEAASEHKWFVPVCGIITMVCYAILRVMENKK